MYRSFEIKNRNYTVIDIPGRTLKNAIRGIAMADAVVLVVDASDNGFERGISDDGKTIEHSIIAYAMGVKQMIVVVNRMNSEKVVNENRFEYIFDEDRFNEISEKLKHRLVKIGFKNVKFIPVGAKYGSNIIENLDKIRWYEGPTLVEAIDQLKQPKRQTDKPLRITVEDTHRIWGIGQVPIGHVEAGVLTVGQKVLSGIKNTGFKVYWIEMHKCQIQQATAGMSIGFSSWRFDNKFKYKKGDVWGDPDDNPPKICRNFTAHIVVINHPNGIKEGYRPILQIHKAWVVVRLQKFISKNDKSTGKITEQEPKILKKGESGHVIIVPSKPLIVEKFANYPSLGRFCIRDHNKIVAIGIVLKVEYEDEE